MDVFKIVIAVFAVIGALDYIFASRFGIGKEFENAFMLMGSMILSMVGMIVLAPGIASLLDPLLDFVYETLHMDPSILPASLFANDMGGASIAQAVMRNEDVGMFNALVVSSMMGCTISFTVPFSLGLVKKEQSDLLLLGLLCGIVTIPLGCFVGGLVSGLSVPVLLFDLLPLVFLAAVIAFGLFKFPKICVRIFAWLGRFMTVLIIVGLVLGAVRSLTGFEPIKGLAPIEDGVEICWNAALFLAGAFPFIHIVSRLLRRPIRRLGHAFRVNEISALCLFSTLASSTPVFGMMKQMDDRGCVLNAAFAVSCGFTFGGHLAFTLAYDAAYAVPMVVGKLTAGVLALVLAIFISRRTMASAEKKTPEAANE